jgi:DNA-binding XRE family transcriptional regulator
MIRMAATSSDWLEVVRERRDLPAPAMREAIRKSAGLSQEAAAAIFGVTRQAFAAWEKGDSEPRPQHLLAYARFLRQLQEVVG